MVRPKKGEFFIHKTLSLEANKTSRYEEIVGAGNLSESIREFISKEVEKAERKKVEGQQSKTVDPLNLSKYNINIDSYITIKESFYELQRKIIDKIDDEKDVSNLYNIIEISNEVAKRAEKRKKMLVNEGTFFIKGRLFNQHEGYIQN